MDDQTMHDELLGIIASQADQIKKLRGGLTESASHVSLTDKRESLTRMAVNIFEGKPQRGEPKGFRELYRAVTGDTEFRASLMTTDWAYILQDAVGNRMAKDYGELGLDTWKAFTSVVNVKDFRQQHRVRFGGYSNLPGVTEGEAYAPLTSPTDEEATYLVTKRGGTEDVTREMIINDEVEAIKAIPKRLARAAAQTLHEFLYDFVCPAVNPVIYDGDELYHSNHLNIATAALDSTSLAAAELRMRLKTERQTSIRLNLRPRYILVPPQLSATAYTLITPAYNMPNVVPSYLQQLGLVPIVVSYWTDATDWVLVADQRDVVGLEVGFIGGEEPSVFLSDNEKAGSMFSNDKMTLKIRHEYGAAIVDWRAFDGSVVA